MLLSGGGKWYSRSIRLACLLFFLIPLSLPAQRYRFRYYSHHDGLKDPEVHSLLQDRSGFLWVGTAAGLFRYDGVRFARLGDPSPVNSICQTPDGTLWIGTRDGLARLLADHLELVDPPGRVQINGHSSIATNGRGSLYVATSNGIYVGRPHGSALLVQHYVNPTPISGPSAHSVHIDTAGVVWFGCGDSLCNLVEETINVFSQDVGVPPDRWDAILTDGVGNLWIRSVRRLMV